MNKGNKKLRNRRRRIILATKRKAPIAIDRLLQGKMLVVPATTTLH